MHEPVEVRAAGPERLRRYLSEHPFVRLNSFDTGDERRIEFRRGGWVREVLQGQASIDGPYGLPELMDNNPLVCADRCSCPGPAATLALVGLGAPAKAGLLAERPAAVFSFEDGFEELEYALGAEGWAHGAASAADPLELGGCLAATFLAAIHRPADADEIEGLFEECFGRSFFVRRSPEGEPAPESVAGRPFAMYQLALTGQNEGRSVLRVQVIADAEGKCGAAQMVHMMNIMAGFEEDLGLS